MPLNPGQSGAPLVDNRMSAIGIDPRVIAMAQGLSFAVPINTTNPVKVKLCHSEPES